ncbi:calcium/manganese antiporter SLC30A10-like [Pseudophryne corroboree]|uniref:calcium/manganese antiporter SLC30A10-like n=1 Tax=Pseudophryne corroboree TaxID=495146 RepID=UPI0030812469
MGRYTGRTARLVLMCVVSLFLFVVELAVGYIGNSLSLSSDGFAVLSHLISMIISLLGVHYSRVQWHQRNTYGFLRADAVGGFGNAVFATALMFSILVEAIKRFIDPQKTDEALLVLIVGVVGLAINIINYLIFMDYLSCSLYTVCNRKADALSRSWEQENEAGDSLNEEDPDLEDGKDENDKKADSLNIRGVLLHALGDALGSVVVVVAAVIFYVKPLPKDAPCNWQCYIDPSLTVVMVAIILFSAYPLIRETATILLQMVPKGVSVGDIGQKIAQVPGVRSIHEIHIWELASGKNIATLHVKFHFLSDYMAANRDIRNIFHAEGVHAVTLQAEFTDEKDVSLACDAPCISKKCDPNLCCSQELIPFTESNGHALKKGKSSQVWYRSNELNTGVKITIDPRYAGPLEGKEIDNGLEMEAPSSKSTQL